MLNDSQEASSMNLIDRVKLYTVEGSNGTLDVQLALTEAAAIELTRNQQGRPEGVTYTVTEITVRED